MKFKIFYSSLNIKKKKLFKILNNQLGGTNPYEFEEPNLNDLNCIKHILEKEIKNNKNEERNKIPNGWLLCVLLARKIYILQIKDMQEITTEDDNNKVSFLNNLKDILKYLFEILSQEYLNEISSQVVASSQVTASSSSSSSQVTASSSSSSSQVPSGVSPQPYASKQAKDLLKNVLIENIYKLLNITNNNLNYFKGLGNNVDEDMLEKLNEIIIDIGKEYDLTITIIDIIVVLQKNDYFKNFTSLRSILTYDLTEVEQDDLSKKTGIWGSPYANIL